MVHYDICVLFDVISLVGNKYFITFLDEFPKMSWLYTIKDKSDVLEVFKILEILVEKQS